MWNWGKEYLQIGWDPDSERPSFFGIIGNIVGSFALLYGSAFVVSLLLHTFIPSDINNGINPEAKGVYLGAVRFFSAALANIPVLIHLRRTHNWSFKNVFFGKSRFGLVWFFATIVATWAGLILVHIFFGGKFHWFIPNSDSIIPISLLAVAILFQSTAEELVFRGYFSKAVYLLGRGLIPVFITIPLSFSLYHLRFDPAVFLVYLEFGLLFSYLSLRTGGLQLSTAVHFANNSFVVLAGYWIIPTGTANVLLAETIAMIVIILLVETALRISKMSGRSADDLSATGVP